MKYHIWSEGCQMNVADAQCIASALENLGYQVTRQPDEANVIVLNTCVVRQSAEDKAIGRLSSLKPLKEKRPDLVINLMGCLVGVKGNPNIKKRFPYVDVFSPPSDPGPLIAYLTQGETRALELAETQQRYTKMDGSLKLPREARGKQVSAYVPVVLGCAHACSFCIIPYKRGKERSRPKAEVLADVRALVAQGVKEVTLLGQIVDRYGKDLPGSPDLASLLSEIHKVEELERIRFLTSHPNWLSEELLETIASLPRVMPHIEVPVQAGDDKVLANMKRGYTAEDYRRLVSTIRQYIAGVAIATDVIVGFPGESQEQFQRTYDLLDELKLDVAHLARYSPRPGTLAARTLVDDVTEEEKWARFRALEELQEGIAAQINSSYWGKTVAVLFEEQVRGRWKGRTPTNKLVFIQTEHNLHAQIHPVTITWTGAWSMQARLPNEQFAVYDPEMISVSG